jgi:hypothetical protein
MAADNLIPPASPATPRTKYLHRPKPGIVLFRYRRKTIARLPTDESSAEFVEAYDALIAAAAAGDYDEPPGTERPDARASNEPRVLECPCPRCGGRLIKTRG